MTNVVCCDLSQVKSLALKNQGVNAALGRSRRTRPEWDHTVTGVPNDQPQHP